MSEIALDPAALEAAVDAASNALDSMPNPGWLQDAVEAGICAYLAQVLPLRPMSEAPPGKEIVVRDHYGKNWFGMACFDPEGVEVPGIDAVRLVPFERFLGWCPAMPPQPVELLP